MVESPKIIDLATAPIEKLVQLVSTGNLELSELPAARRRAVSSLSETRKAELAKEEKAVEVAREAKDKAKKKAKKGKK